MEVAYKLTPVDFDPFADGELEKVIPVTESQQEIWLACALGADDAACAYNESVTVRFEGSLDITNLDAAILSVVERHEALRATFGRNGEELFVYHDKKPTIAHLDLCHMSAPQQEEQLAQLARADSSRPFDLEKGPLIRFHIVKLHDTEHLLRITAHHIVCDGWSFGILLEDLGQLYSSSAVSYAPALTAPESMRAYAQEAKNYLNTPEYQETEAYWMRKFADGGTVVELPVDQPRPPTRTYPGNRIDVALENHLVEKIKQLGKRAGTNMVTTLLAAFELFLRDLTSQDDLVVGLPAAGQAAAGHFGLIGHCVNFLPIRSRIDQDKRVVDYLKQRKTELLDDLDYQRITFGSLLKKLPVPRKPGYIPLVSIVFNVDMGMDSRVSFTGLNHRLVSNPRSFENFELYLNITGSADATVLEWSYNTNLFKAETIQQWIQRFTNLLDTLADHPEASISAIERNAPLVQNNALPPSDDDSTSLAIEQAITELPGIDKAAVLKQDAGQLVTYFTVKHDTEGDKQSSWKEKWDLLYDMAANASGDEEVTEQNLDLVVAEQLGAQDETVKQQAEEWMQQSIERIRALAPQHILEVGCGAGQLIFELTDHVSSYIATDYADTAITDLKNRLANAPNPTLSRVTALVRDADDFSGLPHQPTDLVLIHSVSQYFPNYQYLYNVIVQAVNQLKRGCVFIGDVQGKNSLPLFHASDQLQRSTPETTVRQFRKIIQNRVKLEHELTIDPGYFYLLPAFIPEITAVDVQLRKGTLDNETTKYHYDVWLFMADETQTVSPTVTQSWQSTAALDRLVSNNHNEIICLTHIPNRRQYQDVALHHFLMAATEEDTIGQFQAAAGEDTVHPDTLWTLGEKHGFNTHVRWSTDGTDGIMEAVFIPKSIEKAVPEAPTGIHLSGVRLDAFTNLPHGSAAFLPKEVIDSWTSDLSDLLGVSSIPQKWIELHKLPTDQSGATNLELLGKYFPVTFPLPPQSGRTLQPSAWWADQLFQEHALDTSLAAWINTALLQHAGNVALEFGDESMSYKELSAQSSRYANQLKAMGVNSGDRVGISLYRGMDLIAMVVAIIRIGAAYVPLDITFPKQRLAAITDQADLKCIVVHEVLIHQYDRSQPVIPLEDFAQKAQSVPDQLPDTIVPDDSVAYVLHTSGSTGKPKGVAMGQRALTNLLLWQRAQSEAGKDTKTLQFAPVTFDVSFQEIFSTLTTGGTLCLIPEEMRYDIPELLHHIDKKQVNRIFLPFVALHALAESGCSSNTFPGSLREVVTAGEQLKITEKVAAFFSQLPHATLSNQYGPTETHVVTALKLNGNPAGWPPLPTIGKPIYNTRIHLLDEHQQPVGPGEIGELVVEGMPLAEGYLSAPDLTTERFVDIMHNDRTVRVYRTGDLAQYDDEGNLIFHGRGDSQVKIRGYRVELGEIEAELTKLEGIGEAVVALGNDTAGIPRLTAYVYLENQVSISAATAPTILTEVVTETQLKTWKLALVRTLPDYMVPHAIVAISHFPLTRSGKIDRKALPSPTVLMTAEPQGIADFVAPRNATERFLAEIWKEALGLDTVSIHGNFFELGGYSLIAVKVMLAIEKQRGTRLPLSTLFENPTIAKLAKLVSGDDEQIKWDLLVPIKADGNRPPLYIVHGAGMNVLAFRPLAGHLDPDQPVYGLQAKGLDGTTAPSETISAIAKEYMEEIRRHNPSGPYAIAGYSAGGTIAIEMAKQLVDLGADVKFVGLIDSYPHDASNDYVTVWRKGLSHFSRFIFMKALHVLIYLFRHPKTYIRDRYNYLRGFLYRIYKRFFPHRELIDTEPDHVKLIQRIHHRALQNYQITHYKGAVWLFRTTEKTTYFLNYRTNAWDTKLFKAFFVVNIKGEHSEIFKPTFVQVLANKLQIELDHVINEPKTVVEEVEMS